MGKVCAAWLVLLYFTAATSDWGVFTIALVAWPALYALSLFFPTVAHSCDRGRRRWSLPGFRWYRVRPCRHRWCVGGDLIRLGVRLLQPARARALRESL